MVLESNEITSVGDELAAVTQLNLLNLKSNRIETVGSSAFCGLRLEILNLNSNSLTALPDLHCVAATLVRLYISGNSLTSISSDAFAAFAQLQQLDLSNNELVDIAPDTLCVDGILKIFLTGNRLTSLPNVACVESTLNELEIDNNAGMSDFSGAGSQHVIVELRVQITSHPGDDIVGLIPAGRRLHFRCFAPENVTHFDLSFIALTQDTVEQIGIRDCSLETAPDFSIFPPGNNIDQITLDGNNIRYLPAHTFRTLTSLLRVYIHRNDLFSLDSRLFASQTFLITHIYLNHNPRLDLADRNLFSAMTSLQLLALNTNNLSSIPDVTAACRSGSLRKLILGYNNINSVESAVALQGCSSLTEVAITQGLAEGAVTPEFSSLLNSTSPPTVKMSNTGTSATTRRTAGACAR